MFKSNPEKVKAFEDQQFNQKMDKVEKNFNRFKSLVGE